MKDFEHTLEMARKTVDALPALEQTLAQLHDSDTAENFRLQLLEDQIENLVTAFQRSTEHLFRKLPNAPSFKRDANLFQRLDDASALWKSATGRAYEDILSTDEMRLLRVMIYRRHKIGHCQAIVDAKYVQQSGDTSYLEGQRLVTTNKHVNQLAQTLEKLIAGLKALLP